MILNVIRLGYINNKMLGLPILIKQGNSKQSAVAVNYYDDASTTLVHEVKRVGFLIDRYVDL